MPNGIELIRQEHTAVDKLFDEFRGGGRGELVGRIADMLHAHDQAEHAVLYPFAISVLDVADRVAAFEVTHLAIQNQIDLVCSLEGPPLADAVAELHRLVQGHVADEEKYLLTTLPDVCAPEDLDVVGARLLQAQQRVG